VPLQPEGLCWCCWSQLFVGLLLACDWASNIRFQDETWKMLHVASCFGYNLLILLLANISTCFSWFGYNLPVFVTCLYVYVLTYFVCIVVQQVLPRCCIYLIRYLFCEEMYSLWIVGIFYSGLSLEGTWQWCCLCVANVSVSALESHLVFALGTKVLTRSAFMLGVVLTYADCSFSIIFTHDKIKLSIQYVEIEFFPRL
jgi:hypothetical protein